MSKALFRAKFDSLSFDADDFQMNNYKGYRLKLAVIVEGTRDEKDFFGTIVRHSNLHLCLQ